MSESSTAFTIVEKQIELRSNDTCLRLHCNIMRSNAAGSRLPFYNIFKKISPTPAQYVQIMKIKLTLFTLIFSLFNPPEILCIRFEHSFNEQLITIAPIGKPLHERLDI